MRRIDDQISPKRFWRDLSFVLVAPCLPSWFLLTTCVLSSTCLPCVLVLPFCALLLTSDTRESLHRCRGPFFALIVHDNWSSGLVTPDCLTCAFRWPRVSAVALPAGCDGCSCFCFAYFHNVLYLTSFDPCTLTRLTRVCLTLTFSPHVLAAWPASFSSCIFQHSFPLVSNFLHSFLLWYVPDDVS